MLLIENVLIIFFWFLLTQSPLKIYLQRKRNNNDNDNNNILKVKKLKTHIWKFFKKNITKNYNAF
jgi:hypothetical protein